MNRITCGADKKSVKTLSKANTIKQAQSWLLDQLSPYKLSSVSWTSQQSITGFYEHKKLEKRAKKAMATQEINSMSMQDAKGSRKLLIASAKDLAQQTALANKNGEQALQARLLDLFSNHFSVTRTNLPMTLLAPTLEVEAIAPNLTETFADMLQAVTQHPAMLLYLNNEKSTGPASLIGERQRKKKNKTPTCKWKKKNPSILRI
ncbi:MAG: hypothetical protein ACJAW1_001272 [Glaciecola sp.]|jgi:uncharacterized protein (DUF1800 family)